MRARRPRRPSEARRPRRRSSETPRGRSSSASQLRPRGFAEAVPAALNAAVRTDNRLGPDDDYRPKPREGMAVNTIHVAVPRQAVWSVLADPRLYANWVVGTSATRAVDGQWPGRGECPSPRSSDPDKRHHEGGRERSSVAAGHDCADSAAGRHERERRATRARRRDGSRAT